MQTQSDTGPLMGPARARVLGGGSFLKASPGPTGWRAPQIHNGGLRAFYMLPPRTLLSMRFLKQVGWPCLWVHAGLPLTGMPGWFCVILLKVLALISLWPFLAGPHGHSLC